MVRSAKPRENIERPTSNTELRSGRGFTLPFYVRRWMFDGWMFLRVHGQGESSAGFQHNPARCLPDELPEQPTLPPAVPPPRGRVRVRRIGLPFDTELGRGDSLPDSGRRTRPGKGVSPGYCRISSLTLPDVWLHSASWRESSESSTRARSIMS